MSPGPWALLRSQEPRRLRGISGSGEENGPKTSLRNGISFILACLYECLTHEFLRASNKKASTNVKISFHLCLWFGLVIAEHKSLVASLEQVATSFTEDLFLKYLLFQPGMVITLFSLVTS